MTPTTQPKPVLITGVWRSGTSLLQALLNHHPRMGVMFEAEPYGLFRLNPDALWPEDWAARLEFFNQSLSRHRINPAALPKQATGRACMAAVFNQFTAGRDITVAASKSPSYHPRLPQLAAAFPQTDFIVIWRDPLDCCRSVVRAGRTNHFFAQPGMLTQTLFGQELLARGVDKLLRAGRRVHQLTYADLVADPEKELRRICDFWGWHLIR